MTHYGSGTFEPGLGSTALPGADQAQSNWKAGCCSRTASRCRWAPLEVVAMVLGFVVFWPLGLLALFVKFKNKEMWSGAAEGAWPWAGLFERNGGSMANPFKGFGGFSSQSGNAAFDDYKRREMERLEHERRKLEDEQRAFALYLKKLREAKDRDEFDRFMAERAASDNTGKQ